ncbi:MAG: hypothetical protein HY077_04905 [Elusimicrobia bacterium]|nr:hypothetical protein [Elusimicrobiota bacterium]
MRASSLAALLLLLPAAAHADAAMPILYVFAPILVLSFFPVVFIEALLYRNRLAISLPAALSSSLKANLASTLAGLPLAWIIVTGLGGLVHPGGAFDPGGFSTELLWRGRYGEFFLVVLLQLGPAYFVSVWIERAVLVQSFQSVDKDKLLSLSWAANTASYAFLFVLCFLLPAVFSPRG